uniref:SAM domain-containing protein n=1 Tax=Plectus sambesii TaxID=2011161 RepID=A0A914UX86_9BILA
MKDEGEFRRGTSSRSTAGGRLGSVGPYTGMASGAVPLRPPVQMFVQWNTDQLCEWLAEIGLSLYVAEARRVVQSGRHLLTMTHHEMEKELCIKSPLHRKRLRLALRAIEEGTTDPASRMDYHQVLRWLDDIGLPQYRDAFAESLVDGPMLVALTAEDLIHMRVVTALHHATIARGIELLRNCGFNLNRIQRKFNPAAITKTPCPHVVETWSQHCTSEWLRTIDLAEFTPNLMCAGIHGALLVLEPTFTAESLAEVLQMPAHKTLLRRHLATHFNQMLGPDIVARKRDVLAQPFVVQLSPALRVRLLKKGFSLSRKKSKNEVYVEPDELVCQP